MVLTPFMQTAFHLAVQRGSWNRQLREHNGHGYVDAAVEAHIGSILACVPISIAGTVGGMVWGLQTEPNNARIVSEFHPLIHLFS